VNAQGGLAVKPSPITRKRVAVTVIAALSLVAGGFTLIQRGRDGELDAAGKLARNLMSQNHLDEAAFRGPEVVKQSDGKRHYGWRRTDGSNQYVIAIPREDVACVQVMTSDPDMQRNFDCF
jgi:hypothetical protein